MFYKDTDSAYAVLEISPDATDDEVKSAYRRMAMKNHPDKVASLGPDVQKAAEEMPLQIGQETSLVIHFADCCAPLPGDEIVGVLRPQIGIEVHNKNCSCLKNLPVEQQIAVAWSADVTKPFMTHLTIDTDNRKNITLDILQQLKGSDVSLDRMSVASKQSTGRIRMEFKAFRKEQVDSIITKIKQISGVREVSKA